MHSLNTSLAQLSTHNPYRIQSLLWDDPTIALPAAHVPAACYLLLMPAAPLSAAPSP